MADRLEVVEKSIERSQYRRPRSLQDLLVHKRKVESLLKKESMQKLKMHDLEYERLVRELVSRKLKFESIANEISIIKGRKRKM